MTGGRPHRRDDDGFDLVIDVEAPVGYDLVELPTGPAAFDARLRPGRRGGWRVAAVAWIAALVAAIGLAVAGGGGPTAVRPWLGWGGPGGTPTPEPTIPDVQEAVWVLTPAAGTPTITTPRLRVSGQLRLRADHVEISLEARGNRVLDTVVVDTWDPNAAARPAALAVFGASFDLPLPRPNGTMWVVVTAYDRSGIPIGGIRRAFIVGPLDTAAG